MSRESLVLLFGLIVFFLPTLGIPEDWRQYGLMASGVVLMLLGYTLRRSSYYRKLDKGNGELGTDSFAESGPMEKVEETVTNLKEEESV